MIKSMTGFGRCELSNEKRKITVELKSVNHRYLDINIRMPKKLNFFEAAIRSLLKEYMQRGKVDVFISYEDFSEQTMAVKYNSAIAKEYLSYLQQMAEEFQLENDIKVSTLSRYPEILTMEEQAPDEDELWSMLAQAIREACTQFTVARTSEGEHLKADLVEKLHHMASNVEKVEQRAPQILTEYRAKLQEKVQELLGDTQIDEARLSTEIILFADKICTDEETVRLKSHITSMLQALEGDEGIGRKLDFIAQEMNREANTILSKSNDLEKYGNRFRILSSGCIQLYKWKEGAIMAGLINIGFGNVVNTNKIVTIINPDSAPAKRIVQRAKDSERIVDATQGRRTKSIILTDSEHVILSALQPETLAGRFQNKEM